MKSTVAPVLASFLFATAMFTACSSDSEPVFGQDAGSGGSSGSVDAGKPKVDSGKPKVDADAPDAGEEDTGAPDSGSPDSGSPDSGVSCTRPSDCPGMDTLCEVRTCVSKRCGMMKKADGTPAGMQMAGDCKRTVCDGAGSTKVVNDDTDVPNDNKACTQDVCKNGVPSNPNAAVGTPCGNGLTCDATGACKGCNVGNDCPGQDTACSTRTCNMGVCGVDAQPVGTVIADPTPGDCKRSVCGQNGVIMVESSDTDVPADDGKECTDNTCSMGAPVFPPKPVATACMQNGGQFCSAVGECVQCTEASQCPGVDTACEVRTCNMGMCGTMRKPAGTSVPSAQGDCKQNQCDGNGAVVVVNDDADLPVDGNGCTLDKCVGGVPSNPAVPDGTSCASSGGNVCEAGACIRTVAVVRVGDGTTNLSTASAKAVVEERRVSDGSVLNTFALPVAANGNQAALTVAGTATADGAISRSADGKFLVVTGFDAAPGTANIANTASATINRVIGRLNRAGMVDTSTKISNAFSSQNLRGGCTADGSAFWGVGSSGGTHYIPFGATMSTGIASNPGNARTCQVIGSQLWSSSGASNFGGAFTIGMGLPTAAGQTATVPAGLPTNLSAYGFVALDRNGDGTPDLLYIADDRPAASGGGVYKFVSADGVNWTAGSPALIATGAVRGLAGSLEGTVATLVAATTLSAPTLIRLVDDLNDDAMMGTVTQATIATSSALAPFRGVALGAR
jgi:hypothetical protein